MILVVGVNGTGKTTTIGKLAWHLQQTLGQRVLIAAADTFRAAAVEQLQRWSERAGCEFVRGPEGSDPGAVAFDAVARGREHGVDVVIIDTAGRLHTQTDLMAELTKVRRVITKQMPDAPHETLMTIDATTGQNGVRQAKLFGEAVDVTGVILTKLDGTAKGGIALAIANELGIPVKLIGIGEQLEDLRPFDAQDFARAAPDLSASAPLCRFGPMDPWVLWLIAAVVLAIGEIATMGFFLAPFAAGALVAALTSAAGAGTAINLIVFLVVSVVALGALRPLARSHRRQPALSRTGTAALVGQHAMVLERIANNEGVGCVRLDGEVWTARAYDEDDVIEQGRRVQVIEIRGATALVSEE